MEFELIFGGTPAEFGVAVNEIDRGFSINGARYPSEGKSIFAIGALRPDANPVSADLFLDDDIEGGSTLRIKIRAHKLPNGRSRLSGHVDTNWQEALTRWNNLEAELSRQGWILDPVEAQNQESSVMEKRDRLGQENIWPKEIESSEIDRTEGQINLDEACKAWAGRQQIPHQNMEEFLDSWDERTGYFYSKDEFKRALKDACSRGIIDKGENNRFKLKSRY